MNLAPIGRQLDRRLSAGHGMANCAPARLLDAATASRQRALALLWRFLSSAQRDDLWQRHFFDVPGSDGRRYRLSAATRVYNIHDLASGMRYCVGPAGVPMGDYLLGQKLWLETDAPGLLGTAHAAPADFAVAWDPIRDLI